MTRHYNAFLLRAWRLGGGTERFEIAHIQSGERTVAPSLDGALAWLGTRLDADCGQEPGGPDDTTARGAAGTGGDMPEHQR